MRVLIVLILIALVGCNSASRKREQKLRDTLEKLSKKADYKPLGKEEAYDFLNQYYLPHLDSTPFKRKIFIHPLNGVDYKERFNGAKKKLETEFTSDKLDQDVLVISAPPKCTFDESMVWDKNRLKNTTLIDDTLMLNIYKYKRVVNLDRAAWNKKYGFWGYMSVSYPLYNANTKKISIHQLWLNMDGCGTGKEHVIYYTKTATGWKED
jgi:hypothetical protein